MDDILFLSSGAHVADPQNFRRLFAVSLWNHSDCADLYFSKGGYSDQVDIDYCNGTWVLMSLWIEIAAYNKN